MLIVHSQMLREPHVRTMSCAGVCVFLHWLQEPSTSPNSSREPDVLDDVEKAVEGLLVNVVPERLFLLDSMLR